MTATIQLLDNHNRILDRFNIKIENVFHVDDFTHEDELSLRGRINDALVKMVTDPKAQLAILNYVAYDIFLDNRRYDHIMVA
ncbi:hypothetical protein [Culicoidibacter larvae]|uniref:Uncharacterized protein n=1 Tax=Culicoidibacter larvae TaxID=2579976 RepID=A0A5R8QE69_9FIRM|nr:hypothetical protein [Culicoidibacter larvae]TLG74293.1 hypothetical protein FEZ08_06190 [Culicoidibacter larvae]